MFNCNSLYSSARFQPISIDTLRRDVPSVFTQDSASRTSDKYQHISSIQIIERLQQEGFVPVFAQQARTIDHHKNAFAKHMLRFRHIDAKPTTGGLYPELILVNSHDGLSSYRLNAGIYRLICDNGLVEGKPVNEVRIRHQGNILDDVIEGTYTVLNRAQNMLEKSEHMASIHLDQAAQLRFAQAAHQSRFGNSELGQAIKPIALLAPRRFQDANENDLFTIYNIAQENIIRGGLRGWQRDKYGVLRCKRTRAITSIDQCIAINKALWLEAEQFMQAYS